MNIIWFDQWSSRKRNTRNLDYYKEENLVLLLKCKTFQIFLDSKFPFPAICLVINSYLPKVVSLLCVCETNLFLKVPAFILMD